jgi:nitroreductase
MTQFKRRSIRKYDASFKISNEELQSIILEANQAPSSMNMQPWRYVIVNSLEGKEELRKALYGNISQLETSSAMIVVFNDLKKFDLAESIYNKAVLEGLMSTESREKQLLNISKMLVRMDINQINHVGLIDCGLAAMQLMLVAKERGYDTCPIGGFNHDLIHEATGMDKERYKPVMIISIGKAAEEGSKTIRLTFDEVARFK